MFGCGIMPLETTMRKKFTEYTDHGTMAVTFVIYRHELKALRQRCPRELEILAAGNLYDAAHALMMMASKIGDSDAETRKKDTES